MRMDHNLAAVLLLGLAAGAAPGVELGSRPELDVLNINLRRKRTFAVDRYQMPRGMTANNRLHTERAPRGSAEEADRIAAAAAKRARKLAKRAES